MTNKNNASVEFSLKPDYDEFKITRAGEYYVICLGVASTPKELDAGSFLEKLRRKTKGQIIIQALDSDRVFGIGYLERLIKNVIEARKRSIMIARKMEVEIMLRVALTAQIADSIAVAGIKPGRPACIIGISNQGRSILDLRILLEKELGLAIDSSVLAASRNKMRLIMKANSWKTNVVTLENFADFLIERSVVLED